MEVTQVGLPSEANPLDSRANGGLVGRLVFSVLIFVVVSIGAGTFLFLSPLGQVSIDMRLQSSSGGYSQLFFADAEEAFIEERSEKELIVKGNNFLKFSVNPIRRTLGDQLRWDPLNTPSEMTLSEIFVQAGLSRTTIPFESLKPSAGMSAFVPTEEGVKFTVETNDSQALLQIELQDLYSDHVRNMFVAALLIGLVAAATVLTVKQVSGNAQGRKDQDSLSSTVTGSSETATAKVPWWVNSLFVVLLAGIALLVFWVFQMQ